MAAPVNPHEGQVAIPWARAKDTGGVVVGVLGARAIAWVEEATGQGFDHIFERFARSMATGSSAGIRYREAAAVVWAGIEHHRRRQGAPGPEYTIEDADEICEEIGRADFYGKAFALMYWSASSKPMRDAEAAKVADDENLRELYEAGVGEAMALAVGTGTPTSAPASEQVSPSTTSGG